MSEVPLYCRVLWGGGFLLARYPCICWLARAVQHLGRQPRVKSLRSSYMGLSPGAHTPDKIMVAVVEREFLVDNLLVRIHLIIEMILVDRPCAMGV